MRRMLTQMLWRFHQWAYRTSGGRLGGRILGMPVLLLTTTGRRSGQPHTTALTYQLEGSSLVVVASNGGARQHPAWYLNLSAHPHASVQIGKERLLVRSHEATSAEYDRLWNRAVQAYRGYATYQTRTTRRIPVVILEPDRSGGQPWANIAKSRIPEASRLPRPGRQLIFTVNGTHHDGV